MATATRANSFTDTIAVQIHLDHAASQVPYSNIPLVEQALAYLNPNGIGSGVATVRDETWAASKLAELGKLGYKLDIYESYNGGNNTAAASLNALKPLVDAGYVRMVEGPLEVDNAGWGLINGATYTALNGSTYGGWQAAVKMQQDLYTTFAAQTDVGLFSLAVPSDGHAGSAAVSAAQQLGLNLTSIAETGNVHFYPHNGTNAKVEMAGTIGDETGYTPGIGFTITEVGFNDYTGGGANVIGTPAVNGVYTLDLFLDAYKAGSELTVYYELFDENMGYASQGIGFEDHWGLFNADGSAKPAATYLHNLMAVIGDNGAAAETFTPGSVDYAISGLGDNGSSLLLQKSNGAFELAVWASPTIYANGNMSTAPTQNVTVTLGATYGQVRIYDPTKGTDAVQTLTNASTVSLAITDHPLIIELPSTTTPSDFVTPTVPETPAASEETAVPETSATPATPATNDPISVGSGSNALVVSVNEDAYQGDAQFTISVDGVQIGDTLTSTASHASGQVQAFTVHGDWGAGQHTVAVTFLNDAYDGTTDTDRNLYVTAIALDGTTDAANTAALLSAGPASFTVTSAAAATPATTGAITVNTGETVTVPDGDTTLTASASGADTFMFANTAPAVVTIEGFKPGTDKISSVSGLHDFATTPTGIEIWLDDGTEVILAGVTDATAAQIMTKTTDNVLTVHDGQEVTTQPGFTNTVTIVGNGTVNVGGDNDTITCSSGTDTINVTAGNVTVKGGTGTIVFTGGGDGTATLDLKGGTTTATFGTGGATVTVAGDAAFTGGEGAEVYAFLNDASIDTAVINDFAVGTDHLQLSGYGTDGVASIADTSAGVAISLADGSAISLPGVHTTAGSQLFT